jgi:hypothetical protein
LKDGASSSSQLEGVPVGGNVWRETDFRLICATNRNLVAEVAAGWFCHDLYFRLAGCLIELPSLQQLAGEAFGGDGPDPADPARELKMITIGNLWLPYRI